MYLQRGVHRIAVVATLAAIGLLTIGSGAQARTIRVALDGTGDYTIVGQAIAAAASGDTISIASGNYEDLVTVPAIPTGNPVQVIGRVSVSKLTIIGDDRSSVILGPPTAAADIERGPTGVVTVLDIDLTVENVTIHNVSDGISSNGSRLRVENCVLDSNFQGIDSAAQFETTVRNCRFVGNRDGLVVFSVLGGRNVLVENCEFTDNVLGMDTQVPASVISNCSFRGGVAGFQVSFGGDATVNNCTFDNIFNVGLSVTDGSTVQVFGNTFTPPMQACLSIHGTLSGSDNELLGGSYATIRLSWGSFVNGFVHNHILNGGGSSVRAVGGSSGAMQVMSFSNNYWGTTSAAQIDQWIFDNNDDPFTHVIIEYVPIIDQPVSIEQTSFGEIKARFGQEE